MIATPASHLGPNGKLSSGKLTAEDYIAWCKTDAPREGRFELVDGTIVMMASERVRHVRVKNYVWLAFDVELRRQSAPFTAIGDGVAVRIDHRTVREPDVAVYPGVPDDNAALLSNPVLVVEVLSPSSVKSDTADKYRDYFALPSLRHYLIVDADAKTVAHHRRLSGDASEVDRDGATERETLSPDGLLHLAALGISVEVADFFERRGQP